MRIIVCGGRGYNDVDAFYRTMSGMLKTSSLVGEIEVPLSQTVIISGHASGADKLAEMWADEHGVKLEIYPADWKKHGRAAGPIRNQQMIDEGKPDCVIAFPGGKGTRDMVRRARNHGIPILRVP